MQKITIKIITALLLFLCYSSQAFVSAGTNAIANINNKDNLSAEQKTQAIAELNALACAEVQCAAGVSKNDPLYDQVSQLQAQGEALKAKGEDIISSLAVYGVEAKASNDDFVYSDMNQIDDLTTSNEQTVARTGQVTQGVVGAAETASGVIMSGTGFGALLGVPLAGLGAYDMVDASEKLNTPHEYQSGQNVLNSFSLNTHGGDISPTKDAAIDLGINTALAVGTLKLAKHADDIVDSVKGVFKKGDVPTNAGNNVSSDNLVKDLNSTSEEGLYNRGGWRKSTIAEAEAQSKAANNGDLLCATCGKDVGSNITVETKNGSLERRGYDLDHYPKTWAERVDNMKSQPVKPTRKEVLDEYNRDVRVQCPECNQGHKFEGVKGDYQ